MSGFSRAVAPTFTLTQHYPRCERAQQENRTHSMGSLHLHPNWFIENTFGGRYADKATIREPAQDNAHYTGLNPHGRS
jgi:hypothetical protein